MPKPSRLRLLLTLPWVLSRYWRALTAWQQDDWAQMISLLEPVVDAGLEGRGDCMLLGIAYASQGCFEKSLWYFEQVNSDELWKVEQPYFYCYYAYALAWVGRCPEAKELLSSASRDSWKESHYRWAAELLKTVGNPEPPSLEGMRIPRLFH